MLHVHSASNKDSAANLGCNATRLTRIACRFIRRSTFGFRHSPRLAPHGMAGFVLANGSMSSNQSGEGDIRRALIEADLVDCMVALPGQLFYSTTIPVCLWVLSKPKAARAIKSSDKTTPMSFRNRRCETLFVDGRKLGTLIERIHRELTDAEFAKIVNTYHAWRGDVVAGGDELGRNGLTATPSKQTVGFFNKNLVMEYGHERAVADQVNVNNNVDKIETEITQGGSRVEKGFYVDKRDRLTRKVGWEQLGDDLIYAENELDRAVVAPDQIRTVIRTFRNRLFTDIFPGRTAVPKTLIFAKDDSHADDILKIVREEFAKETTSVRRSPTAPPARSQPTSPNASATAHPLDRSCYSNRIASRTRRSWLVQTVSDQ